MESGKRPLPAPAGATPCRTVIVADEGDLRPQWPKGRSFPPVAQITVLPTPTPDWPPRRLLFRQQPRRIGQQHLRRHRQRHRRISARNDPHGGANKALISDPNDFDRDNLVNATDEKFARNNGTAPAPHWSCSTQRLSQNNAGVSAPAGVSQDNPH